MIKDPSWVKATKDLVFCKVCKHSPEKTSQIFTVRSTLADAIKDPSLLNDADNIISVWPSSVFKHLPVDKFQIFRVLS